MKKFQICLFIIFSNLSCTTNYFNSTQHNIVSDDSSLKKVKLGEPLDSIEMYLFGDYHKFEKDKENIWIEKKEFSKLLYHKLNQKPNNQVLFTFNDMSEFNNMFGFYYEELDLNSVKKSFNATNFYKYQNGITYFYTFDKYKISDSFVEKGKGMLRIITLNNPLNEKDKFEAHYHREVSQLLFQLNDNLFHQLENDELLYSTSYSNYLKYLNSQTDTTAYGKQIKATALSFIGDYETRNMLIGNLFQYQTRKPFEISDEFSPIDAKDFILSQTKNQEVVMFNENHMNPENRIFFASMLESFKMQGFKAIAFEALAYEDSAFVREVPTLKSGFYTREPEFGNLLRKAKDLGFEIYAYENNLETDLEGVAASNFRDSIQAENLHKIYIENKKLLVFAGHGHIEEKQRNEWNTMAQRFYEITNVNPLTIEQAIFSNLGNASWRNNVSESFSKPSVFINKDQNAWTVSEGFFDVQVFFPQTDNWYKEIRIPYILKFQDRFQGNIVHIYKSDDDLYSNPIPVAIQEIYSNQNAEFHLPEKGKYKVFVLTEYGQKIYEEEISL